MPLDVNRTRQYLKDFNLKSLFVEELGWDHHTSHLEVSVDGQSYFLTSIAQKRGMVSFTCSSSDESPIPNYPVRRKIESQVSKSIHEHLIIYTDKTKRIQVWQWVKRETGKPTQCREHSHYHTQPGDALIQKLQFIVFTLEDEERGPTIPEVVGRVRAAFDVDRVTKRFYDRFKSEHDTFLKFLKGIPDEEMQRWYASVMLNRLMFVYFIQKKGFLDKNTNYLGNKLTDSEQRGKDWFYKDFLCPLFFEGFAKKEGERKGIINQLLGKVPFLNGGIFQPHQLEELYGKSIQIGDAAFEKLFNFFDQYQWHLDERPLRADNEINPDVLGYIFEKYINQKQMGAYYTKEDITEYISKNTIIPYLFDEAKKNCKIAFVGANSSSPDNTIWRLLEADPDRYIYDAVKKGIIGAIHESPLPLPPEIAAGLNDVSKRTEWNKPAPEEYALPTEIWREVVTRRKRYEEVRAKLSDGEIRDINDFITYNLNIRQFAQDVIENCEGPELLRAFWHAIEQVSILDPTCGSGAFLFAALNILEPLYEACLERMEVFLDELERSGEEHRPEKFSDFHKVLERIEKHPNRRYFIFKSIIVNNLYGVDIMEEAIEICKLRLFLKLVAQVGSVENIEPLPDIDFNIRAGNTLVGYATYDEVKKAVLGDTQRKFDLGKDMQRIDEKAQDVDRLFKRFREQQTELGGEVTPADKQELRNRLKALEEELNHYLAGEYGIDIPARHSHESGNPESLDSCLRRNDKYQKWLNSHKPFHWFIEFYGTIKKGGFDVIIGNPPYMEYSKVAKEYSVKNYRTESCGNLYAFVMERNQVLVSKKGHSGMIVPHSAFCTDRMGRVINLFDKEVKLWTSTYAIRPCKLFVGSDQRLAIYLTRFDPKNEGYSTCYHRWHEEFRPSLFDLLKYAPINSFPYKNSLPKVSSTIESNIWNKIQAYQPLALKLSGNAIAYYHNAPRYWIRSMTFAPYFWNDRDGEQISVHVKSLKMSNKVEASTVVAALNSTLFYWWFIVLSDCRDLNRREIETFPIGLETMSESIKDNLSELTSRLMKNYKSHAVKKEAEYKATGKVVYDEFYPKYSKPIIDEIDRVLAKHYGFTGDELDFIINYDIKYRMGRGAGEETEKVDN